MILFLFIFWLILSGNISIYFIVSAVLSVLLTVYIDKKLFAVSPLVLGFDYKWFLFIAGLFKEMFLSTILMLKVIWLKAEEVEPVTVKIKAQSKDNIKQVIQANCITLTPGTMTLKLENNDVLVHAISKEAAREIFGDKK